MEQMNQELLLLWMEVVSGEKLEDLLWLHMIQKLLMVREERKRLTLMKVKELFKLWTLKVNLQKKWLILVDYSLVKENTEWLDILMIFKLAILKVLELLVVAFKNLNSAWYFVVIIKNKENKMLVIATWQLKNS